MIGLLVTIGTMPAGAETAAALVLELSGTTTPALSPFQEIPVGQAVTLEEGAKLEFLHYASCTAVTVAGGRISFSAQNYRVGQGRVLRTGRSDCPERVTLAEGTRIGGVIMREGRGETRVSQRPSIALIGNSLADYDWLTVEDAGKLLLKAKLEGSRFDWPQNLPPLKPSADYLLTLASDAGDRKLQLKLQTTDRASGGPLAVVRVD